MAVIHSMDDEFRKFGEIKVFQWKGKMIGFNYEIYQREQKRQKVLKLLKKNPVSPRPKISSHRIVYTQETVKLLISNPLTPWFSTPLSHQIIMILYGEEIGRKLLLFTPSTPTPASHATNQPKIGTRARKSFCWAGKISFVSNFPLDFLCLIKWTQVFVRLYCELLAIKFSIIWKFQRLKSRCQE